MTFSFGIDQFDGRIRLGGEHPAEHLPVSGKYCVPSEVSFHAAIRIENMN